MKITLIIPPFKISKRFGLPYPIGLGYLGTVLKMRGHKVKIVDCDAMRLNFNGLFKILLTEKPDILGITATSYSRFAAIEIANAIKPALPKTYIAVGGPHFTATAEDALKVIKNIDFVVRGEGENTIAELAEAIENNRDFKGIRGISFSAGGGVVHNPDRELIADLNSLPLIDRSLIDDTLYYERMPHSDSECKSVLASRGCPFNCAFCFPHDRSYRRRSNSNILDEVEYLIDRYKVKAIRFFDLTFTLSQGNVEDFCLQIKQRKLNFAWYCESRVDIDLRLLELMKEAGCSALDFGLESASKKVLNLINKKIAPEQALAFAKKCKGLGIKTRVFLMLSLPGEDRIDAEETYNFTHKLLNYASALGIQVTQIIPGTEVERRAKSLGLLEKDFSWNSAYKSRKSRIVSGFDMLPLYIENLSFREILDFYRKYSVFDIYNIKSVTLSSLSDKLWKGLTNWDKGFIFKLNWLILFIRKGLARIFKG